jgi:hypothetical protein
LDSDAAPPQATPTERDPRWALVSLAALAVLAAALRFTGLDWNLRHLPHYDEGAFVYNVARMLEAGDLDHRYYEYPALFFYLLLPVQAFFDPRFPEAGTFYAARALVAAFGVLGVPLVYALGRRWLAPVGALAAAGLVAVDPVGVQTAHSVRADVVLAVFAMLALMAFSRPREGPWSDALCGAALGAAVAIKFTGALLAVPLLAWRVLEPRSALRALAVSALVALVVFFALTPYALIHAREFLSGIDTQLTHHYQGSPEAGAPWSHMALAYAAVWIKQLGAGGALLAAGGLALGARRWRRWLPLAAFPLATVAVMGTSELRFDRHMLASFPAVALFAGLAVQALASRRAVAAAIGIGLLAPPLAASIAYVDRIRRPGALDVALDWIGARTPAGARIVAYTSELGLDPTRYEVMRGDPARPARRLHGAADLVVYRATDDVDPNLELLLEAAPRAPGFEAAVRIARPPRRDSRALPLQPEQLLAQEAPEQLPALVDGDLRTFWSTRGPQRPGDWLEVELGGPVTISRVELVLGPRTRRFASSLQVFVRAPDCAGEWRRVGFQQGRPPVGEQVAQPKSQLLLLAPVRACGLRLVQMGRRRRPWGAAELRIEGPASATPPAGDAGAH